MFDLSHAEYLVRIKLKDRLHKCAYWILKHVPSSGRLKTTTDYLAGERNFSRSI